MTRRARSALEGLQVHFPVRGGLVDMLLRPSQAASSAPSTGSTSSIRRGEILALVGESGSGKTTTGRVVVKLTRQTGGRIVVRRRGRVRAVGHAGACAPTGGGSS